MTIDTAYGLPAIAWSPDWMPFLDIDGTLVDFAESPSAVRVPAGLPETLDRLMQVCGAFALVTGRGLPQVDALFGHDRYDVAANHGAVLRVGGRVSGLAGDPAVTRAISAAVAPVVARHPGAFVEDKAHSIALHYRLAPTAEPALAEAARAAVAAIGPDWRVLSGKSVVEIAPAAATKGTAIEALMASAPAAGRRPFFAGDDVTDEDAFETVERLGGTTVLIGAPRPTAARHRIASPTDFRAWLAASLGAAP